MNEEATSVTLLVIAALDCLGVPYFIAGSLASSLYGLARSTLDTDLVADIKAEHVLQLKSKLQDQFYITEEEIRSAIRHRSSFNVIHYETVFKVDIFLPKPRPFDKRQFQRSQRVVVTRVPEQSAYVASAEDTILAKLEWYRLGNEVSERQWLDILGVLKIQGDRLSLPYLRQAAAELGLSDLLENALKVLENPELQ